MLTFINGGRRFAAMKMSYGRFVSVIAGRPVAFLTALGSVVLAVLLGTWLMQPRYVAKADVIVEPRGWVAGQMRDSSYLATEADLLRSERVATAVLRQLNLQKDPALLDKWNGATGGRGDFEAWATEQLSKKLDVKPGRDSNMLSVTYSSPDPEAAARTVNAFVKAYVDTARQIREETAAQSSESFSDRTKSLKTAVQLAQEKLATFQQENGVAFDDEKLDVETLRLAELNTQLVALQSNAAAAFGRQKEAAARGSGMQEVLSDRLVATLSADLARQDGRLEELRSRAGDQNPALIEQRSVVNALRRELDAATARATSSIASESRIAAQRAGALQAALTAQRAKVLEVKAKRNQAQVLQRDLELARKAFDSAVTKSNESMLDSGASRGNVTIVKAATVPHSPAFPRPAVNLAASIVMGLLAAIAVVFWRESRDRRLRQDVGRFRPVGSAAAGCHIRWRDNRRNLETGQPLMTNDVNQLSQTSEAEPGKTSADARQLMRRRRELAANEQPDEMLAFRHELDVRSGGVAAELRSRQFHYPLSLESAAAQSLPDELIAAKDPFSDRAEEFRALRRSILETVFTTAYKPALAILSAETGDGKSYLAANLAISFGQFGGRTLLIDANLRRPHLHQLLGTPAAFGLSNLLAGEFKGDAVVAVDGLEGLHLLGAGLVARADPLQLLQGVRFSMLLEQLVDKFDYVFIDTPSNDEGADARLIAARAGAALIVGRRGHSRVARMRRFLSQLNMGPSLVAGVVMSEH